MYSRFRLMPNILEPSCSHFIIRPKLYLSNESDSSSDAALDIQ